MGAALRRGRRGRGATRGVANRAVCTRQSRAMRSAIVVLATEEVAIRELAATLASSLCAEGRASTLVWVSEDWNRHIAPPPVMAAVRDYPLTPGGHLGARCSDYAPRN